MSLAYSALKYATVTRLNNTQVKKANVESYSSLA